MSEVYVSFSGPVFDGRAEEALHRGLIAVRERVADRGASLARGALTNSIRVNTGNYLSRIEVIDDSKTVSTVSGRKTYTMPIAVDHATEHVVTVDLASYGPWIEGTGSRNQTTRFKGYHGFRRAGEALNRVAGQLADAALKPYTEEMNA